MSQSVRKPLNSTIDVPAPGNYDNPVSLEFDQHKVKQYQKLKPPLAKKTEKRILKKKNEFEDMPARDTYNDGCTPGPAEY